MMGITSQSLLKTTIVFVSVFQLSQAQATDSICKVSLVVFRDTLGNNRSFTYDNTAQICTSDFYNASRAAFVMIHPYQSNPNRVGPQRIISACLKNGTLNCIAVDWSCYASTPLFPIDVFAFPFVAANEVGQAFKNMIECMPPSKLYLFGASMGGWIGCYAAGVFKTFANMPVALLFGLDISRVQGNIPSCDSSCCDRRYSGHSDWKKFGVSYSSWAKINILFNADTYDATSHQPGCPAYNYLEQPFSTNNICNHQLCILFVASAMETKGSLLCNSAENVTVWKNQGGVPNKVIDVGQPMSTPLDYSGNYYCTTAVAYPYGIGEAGLGATLP